MPAIANRFTERFHVRHPLAQAGMAFAGAEPELAIEVSRAGGIGALGVGLTPPEELRAIIRRLRQKLEDAPFNINFITFFGNEEAVRVAAEEKVPVVSFHWGHPPQHQIDLLRDAGVSMWEQVGDVAAARLAVDDGFEVIVAQGWEAGGHNYGGLGLASLVPAIVDAVGADALVLAAGGIADARGVAAALALGADGVWVGTRFVASTEANVHPEHHRRLVEATGDETLLSSVFGPEMPAFNPMRLLAVDVVRQYNNRVAELPTDGRDHLPVIGETTMLGHPHVMHRFDVILPTPETTGDFEEMAWLSGQGVGLIRDILPARVVVSTLMEGAAELILQSANTVVA